MDGRLASNCVVLEQNRSFRSAVRLKLPDNKYHLWLSTYNNCYGNKRCQTVSVFLKRPNYSQIHLESVVGGWGGDGGGGGGGGVT